MDHFSLVVQETSLDYNPLANPLSQCGAVQQKRE